MKKYLIIAGKQFSKQSIYKFDFITSLLGNAFNILASIFIWNSIYDSTNATHIHQFSQNEMISYLLLANLGAILFSSGELVKLGFCVKTGKLTTYLLRPYSFLWNNFAEYLGSKMIYLLLYFAFIIYGFTQHHQIMYSFALLCFITINLVMFFLMVSCLGNLGFWLLEVWPLRPILNFLFIALGGLLFPINLLPSHLFNLFAYTPFALVGYHYTIALQKGYTYQEIFMYSCFSLGWALFFYLMYQFTFRKGLQTYEGMGS